MMCMSAFPVSNVVPLTREAKPLFQGQTVRCADPDLADHPQAPIYTQGRIKGFDEERGDVLVILTAEPEAARRFKPYQVLPDSTP